MQYFLNTSNTGLVAYKDGKVATLFRIDKRGNNLAKVAKYFGDSLKNKALAQALASYAGSNAETTAEKRKNHNDRKRVPTSKPWLWECCEGGNPWKIFKLKSKDNWS